MTVKGWKDGHPANILLATDLGPRTDRALDRAASLAASWNARLVVAHAIEATSPLEQSAMPSWRQPRDPLLIAEQRVRADVRDAAPGVITVVEPGDTADVILNAAAVHDCGLIVTGVARDEPFGRLVLGSTVDKLLARAPVPVLVVRRRSLGPYSRIVVATDFSEASRFALEAAVQAFPEASFCIFHAHDAPLAGLASDSDMARQQWREAAAEDLRAFLDKSDLSPLKGRQPVTLLEYGTPDRILYEYTTAAGIDLVIMGTHGHGAVYEALIGSTARRLASTLPCDAMLIPAPRPAR